MFMPDFLIDRVFVHALKGVSGSDVSIEYLGVIGLETEIGDRLFNWLVPLQAFPKYHSSGVTIHFLVVSWMRNPKFRCLPVYLLKMYTGEKQSCEHTNSMWLLTVPTRLLIMERVEFFTRASPCAKVLSIRTGNLCNCVQIETHKVSQFGNASCGDQDVGARERHKCQ